MSFALSPRPSKRRRIETEKQIEMVSKITKNMVGSKNAILQAKLKNLQLKKNKLDILCYAKEPKQHTLSEFDVLIAANEVEVELEILRSSKRFKRMEDRYLRRFCQAKHSRDDSTTPEKISRSINTPTNITLSQDKENIPRNLTTRSMCDKSVNTDPVHIEEIIPDNRSTGLCSTEHNVLMFSDLEKSLSPVRRQIPLSDNKRLQIERLQTNKENFVSSDQIEPNWFESSFEIDLLNERPKRSQNILYSDISSSSISKYSSSNEKYQDFTQIDGSNLINTQDFAIDLSNYLKDNTVTFSVKKAILSENNDKLSQKNMTLSENNLTLKEDNMTLSEYSLPLSENNVILSENTISTSKPVKKKDKLKIPETLTPISISTVRIPRTIIKSTSNQNLSSLENINSQNTTKAIVFDTAVPKNNMFPKHTKKFSKPGVEFEKAMETEPNQKDEQNGNSPLSTYSLEVERQVLLTKLQELCVKYQNLAFKSENLTTNSQGLSTKCLNLQNSKDILSTGSKELTTKSQNISNKSKDLSNKSNKLTTKSKEYSIKCEKLSTKYRDLLARSKEISTKAQHISKDLSTKPQDTCISNSILSMKSKEFSTKLQELSAKSIQMSTKCKELSVRAKETAINHKELE